MWLITREGFYSAVRERSGAVRLQARVRADLEQLRTHLAAPVAIVDTPGAEYACEMRLTEGEWLLVMMALAGTVDYADLATAVAADPARSAAYLQVWLALRELQEGVGGKKLGNGRFFGEADAEPADVEAEAFALLDALREAGGFDVGTAVVTLQFHLGLDEEVARRYLADWK